MRKTIALILLLFSVFTLASCETDPVNFRPAVNELSEFFSEGDSFDSVTKDLNLKVVSTILPDAKVFWRTSNEEVIKISKSEELGIVTRPEDSNDVEVTITLRIVYKFQEAIETFVLNVIAIDQFNVNFNLSDEEVVSHIILSGNTVEFPEDPVKEDYIFRGWLISGTEEMFTEDDIVSSHLDLEPKWVENNFEVSIDGESQFVVWGTILNLEDAIKEGHEFDGWFVVGTEEQFLPDTPIIDNIALEARFSVMTFVVTVDAEEQVVNWGEKATLVEPTKEGHNFDGWFVVGTDDEFLLDTLITAPISIESRFSIKVLTVLVDGQAQDVNWGDKLLLEEPVKEGYIFDAWYYLDTDNLFDVETIITEKISITAKYTRDFTGYLEQILYETGFEDNEGFTASSSYNNQEEIAFGLETKQWITYYGTPSTTSAISGSQSVQMRVYTSALDNLGYLRSAFNFDNITKVEFSASKTSNVGLDMFYSLDNGLTWIGQETIDVTTSKTTFTYQINVEQEVMIKFQLTESGIASTSRLYIDDVKVYGMAEPFVYHNVNFNTDGGNPIDTISVKEGDPFILPEEPAKEGFTFDGWFMDIAHTTPYVDGHLVTDEITLFAKWEEIILPTESFTVTLMTDNGRNATQGDVTSRFGLDENIFEVISSVGDIGFYDELRFYNNARLLINVKAGYKITGISFIVDSWAENGNVKIGETTTNFSDQTTFSSLNETSVEFINIQVLPGKTNRVYITSISITCEPI